MPRPYPPPGKDEFRGLWDKMPNAAKDAIWEEYEEALLVPTRTAIDPRLQNLSSEGTLFEGRSRDMDLGRKEKKGGEQSQSKAKPRSRRGVHDKKSVLRGSGK